MEIYYMLYNFYINCCRSDHQSSRLIEEFSLGNQTDKHCSEKFTIVYSVLAIIEVARAHTYHVPSLKFKAINISYFETWQTNAKQCIRFISQISRIMACSLNILIIIPFIRINNPYLAKKLASDLGLIPPQPIFGYVPPVIPAYNDLIADMTAQGESIY